ncbi:hypothetical protein [Fontivita pretiosa]|uniref:hypothetical protein n=1 Tax=Fontivita pretiosa TaxID=2989684 RepID=UPI003D17E7B7
MPAGGMTLRQLLLMAEGRIEQEWNHTAAILAMLANVNRDPKKGRALRPADFHPSSLKAAAGAKPLKGDIRLLKSVFVDQTMRLIGIIFITLALAGCRTRLAPIAQPVVAASDGVAGVVAHTESAERHVQRAVPHSDSTGKVYLAAASDEHKEVLLDAEQTKVAIQATQRQITSLNDQINRQELGYQRLESRWYVVWGRRIDRAVWIIGVSWLILGVASVVLGMGSPLGWGAKLGKEIVRLVPAMNVFAWLRDWIKRRRDYAAGG